MKRNVPYTFPFFCFITLIVLIIISSGHCYAQTVDFGKSYINVSKGLNGGTLETGDTLEIRASFVVRSGTYDSCRYRDNVPTGTTFIPGTIRVLTNEGKVYKQFTDGYGDDPGWITGTQVTIHLGFNPSAAPATAFRRGRVANTHKPSFYGSTCIMIASFRVVVTAVTGSNISTGGGTITYKNGSNPIQTYTFPSNIVRVYPNYGICSNTIGTNAIGTEFNGTFGNGQPRNRGTSANVPTGYTYNIFNTNSPQDYYYGIANNTSTRVNYTTLNTWAKPDNSSPTHRVFTVWDIIGDHTGAADPYAGNPAADTVANPNAGYMLVINAAYRIDSAFQQTISGLCPNTYYEISCWMRNICSKCGCDSNGRGATSSAGPPYYIPTATGDSSGVRPNITFEIDGVDYYTTGDLLYTGQWVKKGFTFLTGPAQTSFTLKYFNNAPGGGGNDWALDDITVATCSPDMKYGPMNNPIVCDSNVLVLSDTIRSYFNNYTEYKWQRSTDGGATWNDIPGATGSGLPVWNGTAWEYVAYYTIPISQTQMSNNGDMYRLVVATTVANLSNQNCSFSDATTITVSVIECGIPLHAKLLSFIGNLNTQQRTDLQWTTTGEDESVQFDIEKSINGSNFTVIGVVNGHNDYSSPYSHYSFTDPALINGKVYYRIRMRNNSQSVYSRTIQVSNITDHCSFISVINPFQYKLEFELSAAAQERAEVLLFDQSGRIVKQKTVWLLNGINSLSIENTESLQPGLYYLRVVVGGSVLQKKVLKQ